MKIRLDKRSKEAQQKFAESLMNLSNNIISICWAGFLISPITSIGMTWFAGGVYYNRIPWLVIFHAILLVSGIAIAMSMKDRAMDIIDGIADDKGHVR